MRIDILVVLIATLAIIGCVVKDADEVECYCSIVELIANPEKYDGMRVQFQGYAQPTGEGRDHGLVYLSKEDAGILNIANAILLDDSNSKNSKTAGFDRFDGKYVLVEGIFRFDDGEFRRVESINRMEIDAPNE